MVQVETTHGTFLGPIRDTETGAVGADEAARERIQVRIGNRDLYGLDFRWFETTDIQAQTEPDDAVIVERQEHGNFHGYVREVRIGDQVLVDDAAWDVLNDEVRAARNLFASCSADRQRLRKEKTTTHASRKTAGVHPGT